MLIAYQYKLLPSYAQRCRMGQWLEKLRHQYNYLLAQRFDWWSYNRCAINACPLTCSIANPRERPEYYGQKRSLVQLKVERPWYKDIHAHVLQDMVKRVQLAFARFVKGDSNGKRSGKPRFKGKGRYRTFKFPAVKPDCIKGNQVTLPKLGSVKFIQHRSIPDGYRVKGAAITVKADGWYITFTLEDKSVPQQPELSIQPTEANSIGVDAGLEYFMACSDGTLIDPPKYFRHSEQKLAVLQQKRELRPKGGKARRKLNERIAKLHQRIARQRKHFLYETAYELCHKADVIFVENLRVSNMARRNKPKQDDTGQYLPNGQSAKSGLNKSFADAGIGGFLNDTLSQVAAKAQCKVIKVNPAGTSQHCSKCLNRVPKTLSDRWHDCPRCGLSIQRDHNSGILIKKVGLGVRLTIKREGSRKSTRSGEASTLSVA